MALFICDSCNHTKTTSDDHIGKTAKCPQCGARGSVSADADSSATNDSADDVFAPATIEPPARPAADTPPQPEPAFAHVAASYSAPEPQPTARTAPAVQRLPSWATIVIRLSFLLLGMFTLGALALFLLSLGNATGAPQEAAIGAIFSALFIAAYILARCVEKIVRATVGM